MGGYSHNSLGMNVVRVPSYTVVDEAAFNTEYWPKIENAIKIMLHKNPGESFQFSCEELFSITYKCTGFSEQMMARVTSIIDDYSSYSLNNIAPLSGQEYLEKFKFFLAQFFQAAEGIAAIFSSMDRYFVVRTFGKNLLSMLYWQLSENIVVRSTVFDILRQITDGALEVDPQLLMTVIQSLYRLREDFASFNMILFRRFIPNVDSSSNMDNCLPSMDNGAFAEEINENRKAERLTFKRKADDSEDVKEMNKRLAKSS